MDENILANLVRIGTVSSVDNEKRVARVIFQDKDMVSGWLHVLQHHGTGVYIKPEGKHSHDISEGGKTELDGEHDHAGSVTYWMPRINDTVVVLYLPVFNADGFILGAI
jgi:phage baseplate assembly protein gpV